MTNLTPFIEANTLLAMQEGNYQDAIELVRTLLPSERNALQHACDLTALLCMALGGKMLAKIDFEVRTGASLTVEKDSQ